MIATPRTARGTLELAVAHLVGQSRAFTGYLESVREEIASLQDERTARVIEALELTLREPSGPGSVRHVELAASKLLRELTTEASSDGGWDR